MTRQQRLALLETRTTTSNARNFAEVDEIISNLLASDVAGIRDDVLRRILEAVMIVKSAASGKSTLAELYSQLQEPQDEKHGI
jgi:hypothetical protein